MSFLTIHKLMLLVFMTTTTSMTMVVVVTAEEELVVVKTRILQEETQVPGISPTVSELTPILIGAVPTLTGLTPSFMLEPSTIEAIQPSLDAFQPSLDAFQPTIDGVVPTLNGIPIDFQPTIDTIPSLILPTLDSFPTIDMMSPSLLSSLDPVYNMMPNVYIGELSSPPPSSIASDTMTDGYDIPGMMPTSDVVMPTNGGEIMMPPGMVPTDTNMATADTETKGTTVSVSTSSVGRQIYLSLSYYVIISTTILLYYCK